MNKTILTICALGLVSGVSVKTYADQDMELISSSAWGMGITTPVLLPVTTTLGVVSDGIKKETMVAAKESAAQFVATDGIEGRDAVLSDAFAEIQSKSDFKNLTDLETAQLILVLAGE